VVAGLVGAQETKGAAATARGCKTCVDTVPLGERRAVEHEHTVPLPGEEHRVGEPAQRALTMIASSAVFMFVSGASSFRTRPGRWAP
jgi:hypothetical protein